jgi:hypothetical protein
MPQTFSHVCHEGKDKVNKSCTGPSVRIAQAHVHTKQSIHPRDRGTPCRTQFEPEGFAVVIKVASRRTECALHVKNLGFSKLDDDIETTYRTALSYRQ